MIIGINLYSLREQCQDPAGLRYTLARLEEIGYTSIQVSGVKFEPEKIAEEIKKSGLTCAATHFSWQQIRDETDRIIEIHKMYGCSHTAVGSAPDEYRKGLSGVDRFAREVPPVAEKLAAAGITLSYHNHHFEFARFGGKTWLEALYETIDPKHLKAELDTYWVQAGGGNPVKWIRKMAGRQPLLHVKDKVVTPTREERFAEIGEGNLDWPEILKAASESGVEYVLVEQDQMYERDPFDAAEISYKFLHSMGLK